MPDQPITLIVSDLHVGDGNYDDDHVHDKNQLVNFIRAAAASDDGCAGRLELFFNGDFLEFAQTATDAFTLVDDNGWCTEHESLAKLEAIIGGHPAIFAALAEFRQAGNVVTIAAGNHDVDLFWPRVQDRLRQVAGASLRFEVGQEWVERHGGQLQIGHGHMQDVANRFKNWQHPIATLPWAVQRLEMCPGTLFMVKFVNGMEAEYPFADNLLPIGKLANVLLKDDKGGFAAVGWAFSKFLATTSMSVLGADGEDDFGSRLARHVNRPERLALLQAKAGQFQLPPPDNPLTEAWLKEHMFALLGKVSAAEWRQLFDVPPAQSLSAIVGANFVDGRELLRKAALKRATQTGASVIVMGHTHQPDEVTFDDVVYYNPGSWTRYWELDSKQTLTLDDLRDEQRYPYQLNVVRVERTDTGLRSRMDTIDRCAPPPSVRP